VNINGQMISVSRYDLKYSFIDGHIRNKIIDFLNGSDSFYILIKTNYNKTFGFYIPCRYESMKNLKRTEA
jgi:hypothetical protein